MLDALDKGLSTLVDRVTLNLFKSIKSFIVLLREVFKDKSLKAKAKRNLN